MEWLALGAVCVAAIAMACGRQRAAEETKPYRATTITDGVPIEIVDPGTNPVPRIARLMQAQPNPIKRFSTSRDGLAFEGTPTPIRQFPRRASSVC